MYLITGARNCFDVIENWESYPKALRKVKNTILHFRRQHPQLQHLAEACGPSATRTPPSVALIDELRARVARKLGLDPRGADRHHDASPWRLL